MTGRYRSSIRVSAPCRFVEGAKATGWHPPHPSSFPRRRQSPTGSHSALTSTFPPDLVDQVIEQTGRTEQRRRLLPARVVVYWVLALAV